jgi:hypothetical protein
VSKRTHKDYSQYDPFDKDAFRKAYVEEFRTVPKFNLGSIPDLVRYLEMMEVDPHVTDLRWMAYMLATAFIESSETVKITRQSRNARGHLVSRTVKVWRNFSPIEEKGHGHGKRYEKPVKLKTLADGHVRVTEWDGDRWMVSPSGARRPITTDAVRGARAATKADARYEADEGAERYYFGRGFVQLTWWDNYLATGVLLGLGLGLLLDPDMVDDPEIAYTIISTGMRTGKGFANGRTFSQFFHGDHTDYVHARSMVNGTSHQYEIGAIAQKFENVLFASRPTAKAAVAVR